MTQYKHRITLIVPEQYMDIANHLALIIGESPADIGTFVTADWQDADGNLYAVCSALSKPIVLEVLTKGLPPDRADVTKAQQALDLIVLYDTGVKASVDNIVLAVDYDPHEMFENAGLLKVDEPYYDPHEVFEDAGL